MKTIGLGLVKQVQLSEVEKVITLWSTEIAIWSTGGSPYSNDFLQSRKLCLHDPSKSDYVCRYSHLEKS